MEAPRRPFPWIHYLRRSIQVGIVVAAAWTGYRFAVGLTLTSVEKYCPMGGLATSYSVASEGRFSCATGEFNFSLLIALVALALIARKSFCSWLCPVGTVSELLGGLVGRIKGNKRRVRSKTNLAWVTPKRRIDGWMRLLRVPVVLAVLYATILSGELLFRPFCPYYVMFSFNGHDVEMWSYALLAVFLVGILVVPMVWCRYLCPLGGALWPFSRFSFLRVRRNEASCTHCGKCDRACAHSIPVSKAGDVTSGECTLCMECVESCSESGTLSVAAAKSNRRWPRLAVPAAVGILLVAGLFAGELISVPSYATEYAAPTEGQEVREVHLKVKGVRCVDTAKLASTVFDGMDGVLNFTAYASRNDVIVTYDPTRIDVDFIVKLVEGPVYMAGIDEYVFNVYEVLEIDGEPVNPEPNEN